MYARRGELHVDVRATSQTPLQAPDTDGTVRPEGPQNDGGLREPIETRADQIASARTAVSAPKAHVGPSSCSHPS